MFSNMQTLGTSAATALPRRQAGLPLLSDEPQEQHKFWPQDPIPELNPVSLLLNLDNSPLCYFSTSFAGGRKAQRFPRSGNWATCCQLLSKRRKLPVLLQCTSAEKRFLGKHHYLVAPAICFCLQEQQHLCLRARILQENLERFQLNLSSWA